MCVLLLINNLFSQTTGFLYKVGITINNLSSRLVEDQGRRYDGNMFFELKFYNKQNGQELSNKYKRSNTRSYSGDDYELWEDNQNNAFSHLFTLQSIFSSDEILPSNIKVRVILYGWESEGRGQRDFDKSDHKDFDLFTKNTTLVSDNSDYQYLADCASYELNNSTNQFIHIDLGNTLFYDVNFNIEYDCFFPEISINTANNTPQRITSNPVEICKDDNFKIGNYDDVCQVGISMYSNPSCRQNFNLNTIINGFNKNIKTFYDIDQFGDNALNNITLIRTMVGDLNGNNYNNLVFPSPHKLVNVNPSIVTNSVFDVYTYKTLLLHKFNNNIFRGSYSVPKSIHVYQDITSATLDIKQPCASNINEKGIIKVISITGGKTGKYSYNITDAFTLNENASKEKMTQFGENIYSNSSFINNNADGVSGLIMFGVLQNADLDINSDFRHNSNYTGGGIRANNEFRDLPYGIYKIHLNSTLYNGGCDYYKWVVIYPMPNPILTLSNETILCEPSGIFEFNASANKDVTWLWGNGNDFNTLNGYLPNSNPHQLINAAAYVNQSSNDISLQSSTRYDCLPVVITDKNNCKESKIIEVPNFNPPSYIRKTIDHVLSIKASRLKSVWLNDFRDVCLTNDNAQAAYNNLIEKNPYESAQAGLCRGVSGYDYVSPRQRLGSYNSGYNVNISTDGIIEDPQISGNADKIKVPLFNWSNPRFEREENKWVKGDEITKYNTNSEEVENKNILGRSSAALFGYKGTLPIAVATNAENREIAFEGFEEYHHQPTLPVTQDIINEVNNMTGNFDIVNKLIPINLKKYERYKITNASGRYAITDIDINSPPYTPTEFETLKLKVFAAAPSEGINKPSVENLLSTTGKLLTNTCTQPGSNFYGTLIQFEQDIPGFNDPFDNCNRFWSGDLYVEKEQQISSLEYNNIQFTNEHAHTGNISVKVKPGYTEMEQFSIELKPGKEYFISGWIKSDQSSIIPTKTLSNMFNGYNKTNGIGVIIKGVNNDELIFPVGPVIEGWQKFETKFQYPHNANKFILAFSNQQTFYLDDIRLCPFEGNIQTYVYDPVTYRQEAILDQNNFATIYKYDEEGKLFQIKKETVEGIKTIQIKQSFMQPN